MEIISLNQDYKLTKQKQSIANSFAIKFDQSCKIWLFNCHEGCQHMLWKRHIKIGHITKIIITKLDIQHVTGLIGILSSLSLSKRIKLLEIYGPAGIEKYIQFCQKYSQTNFRYSLHIHKLKTGLICRTINYELYALACANQYEFTILTPEKKGKFKFAKAQLFHIITGPLYGKLKTGSCFLLPDGFIMHGREFAEQYFNGHKINILTNSQHTRRKIEMSWQVNLLAY